MAKITFEGLEAYLQRLNTLNGSIDSVCKAALYDGAKIVADAISGEIDTVERWTGFTDKTAQGLKDGLGIAEFEVNGSSGTINTKIGFEGYNEEPSKKYPKGRPNALIARSLIRGTSFRYKNDFVGRAVRKSKPKAIEAMRQTIEHAIEEIENKK